MYFGFKEGRIEVRFTKAKTLDDAYEQDQCNCDYIAKFDKSDLEYIEKALKEEK